MISQGVISTPVGMIKLEGNEYGLRFLQILTDQDAAQSDQGYDSSLTPVVEQLHQYFEGDLKDFSIPFDLRERPDFFVEVWRVLCTIPYGKTRTYSEIARFLQNPKWARAVGNASSHNPLAIVVPCHRVIGKNGRLTGYAYGKNIKRQLLQHENPGHYAFQGKLFQEGVK